MKKVLRGLWALGGMAALGACSVGTERCDDVNQDRIHQAYGAYFDGERNQTTVTAQFRFGAGGTTLELVGNCNVTHSVIDLDESPLSDVFGTSYDGSQTGFLPSHTFVFTDANARQYTNGASLTKISIPGGQSRDLTKGTDFVVTWGDAGGLSAGQTVDLYLRQDTEENPAVVSATQSADGADRITLAAADFADIPDGDYRMWLELRETHDLQEAAEGGGEFTTTYATAKVVATVSSARP